MSTTRPKPKKRIEQNVRQPKNATLPYIILSILLFGRMKWVRRDGTGWARAATRNICPYLRTQPDHLKGCLKSLENWGLIRSFNWYRTWFEVELEIPVGMAIHVPAITVQPSEEAPEMFEVLAKGQDFDAEAGMAGFDIDAEEVE